MYIKIKQFVIFITLLVFFSCKQEKQRVYKIEGKQIQISDSITSIKSLDSLITPFRKHLERSLDSTLAYAPKALTLERNTLNTSIGNLMADILMTQAAPIFKKRTGKKIDFVLLNEGGIRAIISKGNINTGTAYNIMPFDNSVIVVELDGNAIQKMLNYLAIRNEAHPISGAQLILNKDNSVSEFKIDGAAFDPDKTYFVATSDFLVNGGDKMYFFSDAISKTNIDYLIRNTIIDYFNKKDTITATIDNRFIKLN